MVTKNKLIIFITFLFFTVFMIISPVSGDRLPNQTPENQIFSIDSVIDVAGLVDHSTTQTWVLASPGGIPTGILQNQQSVADTTYTDTILTNGGKLSLNKNYQFDSTDRTDGRYSIETEKVLTFASTEGAHMVGEEELALSIAGNYAIVRDSIRCVFSASHRAIIPAFCNAIKAKSSLININSAQVSTKAQSLTVAAGVGVPTTFNYQIAISPDISSGSGFAEGTVNTLFAGSIMEARDGGSANYESTVPTWNKTAAEVTWKDTSEVTGGIKNFRKSLGDPSGFKSGILGPLTQGEESPDQTGTIHVDASDAPSAPYTIHGPQTFTGPGTQDFTAPAGQYQCTVQWPIRVNPTGYQTLDPGGEITFYIIGK